MFTSFDWLLDAVADPAATAAATDAAGTAADGGILAMLVQLLPMIAIIVVFYFVLIRPQRKKDKAVKEMLAALKPGDRICTIGGIYGTIKGLREDTVILNVGRDDTEIVFARWAIRNVEAVTVENEGELLA